VWFAPFRLTLTHLKSLGGGRRPALALAAPEGSAPWADLMLRLDAQLRREGMAQPRRAPGLPHLTLLYAERPVPATALADPVALDFASFALVRGAMGAPAYREFGRWDGRGVRA
jgi:2'-5' RNA ligase